VADELGLDSAKEEEADEPKGGGDAEECPFDHTFGKDNDKFDDCDDCEIWNECNEMKKQLRR